MKDHLEYLLKKNKSLIKFINTGILFTIFLIIFNCIGLTSSHWEGITFSIILIIINCSSLFLQIKAKRNTLVAQKFLLSALNNLELIEKEKTLE